MVKDKSVPIFIGIFAAFLLLFENSIHKIIELNSAQLSMSNNPILKFEIIKNYGAAWGVLQNSRVFLVIFGILMLAFVLFYAVKNLSFDDKFEVLSTALFVSGTLGNTFERITLGYVIDYIKITFFDFPTFNIFDICIVCGIIIFAISYFIKTRRAK